MKPVAYAMFRNGEYYDAIHPDEQAKTVGEYYIPLYTHPVKELALTDEEMISIYEKDWSGIKCGLGRAVEQAILRKAQE
jgi:hypothetical protein